MSLRARVENRLSMMSERVIELEKDLVAIPALGPENGGDGELDKAEYMIGVLKRLNPDELYLVKAPDKRVSSGYRPNIIAKFPGKVEGPVVWVLSHLDIVPPGDLSLWKGDPFQVWVEGDKVFGRGTEDNHHGIISSLIPLEVLMEAGELPYYPVGLALVADEETGSGLGLDYLIKNSSPFKKEDLIIVPDAGNKEGTMIEIAEKSVLWIRFEITGKQCHASTPRHGKNTLRACAHLIVALEELSSNFSKEDPLFDPPLSTFEPTKKEANVPNVNTIPGKDVFYMDCRLLPGIPVEKVTDAVKSYCREIEEKFDVKIDLSYPLKYQAPPKTPEDAPVVKALSSALREVMGKEPRIQGIGGATVAAFFRQADLPAVAWCTVSDTAHQPNEYCLISNIINDAKVFAHIYMNGYR